MRVGFKLTKDVPKHLQDHLYHVVQMLVSSGRCSDRLRVKSLQEVGVELCADSASEWLEYWMDKEERIAVENYLHSDGDGEDCWLRVRVMKAG
jgi:hypothetical protein